MNPAHSDSRRNIYEFKYPFCKLVVTKEDCLLGAHFHNRKEELFVLLAGEGTGIVGDKAFPLEVMEAIPVPVGIFHSFTLKKGSILLGFASVDHDPTDEIRVGSPPPRAKPEPLRPPDSSSHS